MKLIVYKTAEFDYNGVISTKEITIFLLKNGFGNVRRLFIGNEMIIVQADHNGRHNDFKNPTTPIPEFYECGIQNIDLDFSKKCAYNAQRLNEICKRNGRQR